MHKHNTIGKGLSQRAINGGYDDYFTPIDDARALVRMMKPHCKQPRGRRLAWVEPAAGDGVFIDAARAEGVTAPIAAFDINPRRSDVIPADWFGLGVNRDSVVFGNPPFGFAASKAVRFFQHAAVQGAHVIAFILPASCAKDSVKRRLHRCYGLAAEEFRTIEFRIPGGARRAVPCVLQVWKRLPEGMTRRIPPADEGNDLFEFTTKADANVAVRRVGGRAGMVLPKVEGSKTTTYFLRVWSQEVMRAIGMAYVNLVFIRDCTAGVRSVAKGELVDAVRKAMR